MEAVLSGSRKENNTLHQKQLSDEEVVFSSNSDCDCSIGYKHIVATSAEAKLQFYKFIS